jgi:nucleotide-binding universal stress UspA family protein
MARSGPVIIAFDGSPAAERALREAAALFAPRRALVVVVFEAGRAFEAATLPAKALEPAAMLDVSGGFEAERAALEAAERLAEQGAETARQAGLEAEGLAVAREVTVAETLGRVVGEVDAQAIVVGDQRHPELRRLVLGSTLTGLLRHAPCPVLVSGDTGAIAEADRPESPLRSCHGQLRPHSGVGRRARRRGSQ